MFFTVVQANINFFNIPKEGVDENYNSFTVSSFFLLILVYIVLVCARFLGST